MDNRQQSSNTARFIRSLDAFSKMMKVPEDLRTQSTTGGTISLISLTLISILFISEFISFLTPIRSTSLSVDTGRDESFNIHLDVNFPYLNCEVLGVDALDAGGTVRLEISNNLFKTPIDHKGRPMSEHPPTRLIRQHLTNTTDTIHANSLSGNSSVTSPSPWPKGCGPCMGAEEHSGDCCNTCESVRKAYERKGWLVTNLSKFPQCKREGVNTLTSGAYDPTHGCNIHGHIQISKVAGRIHITPGHSFSFAGHTIHDYSALRDKPLDLSHYIRKLSFGVEYPGQANPLDKTNRLAGSDKNLRIGQHEYFIRIVPTTYKYSFGRSISTNQYSQTYFFKHSDPSNGGRHVPGLFFNYDLSPIHVEVNENRPSFIHFIVQLCAIIGGVFTVASMVSTFMDDVVLKVMRKRQTGKQM